MGRLVEARPGRAGRVLVHAVLLGFAGFYLAPLAIVALNSFRSLEDITRTSMIGLPREMYPSNWVEAWGSYCIANACNGIAPYLWNSLLLVVPATLISTALGALAGYALSLRRFPGANALFATITLGVFLPAHMKLVPWAISLGELGLSNTIAGLVLIHVVQGMSFTTLFCRNYYANIPPDLIRAARVDGAGFFRIFRRIVLPLSPPILAVTVIWQFTNIWNEYLFGATFTSGGNQPVTVALMAFSANVAQVREFGIESAAVLIAALPTLLVYLFGGKYFVRGLTAGAVK